MSKKQEKAKEYADWLHKEVEEYNGSKCKPEDMYYRNGDIRDAYQEGWDEALKNQWVKVEEKLPETYKDVLIVFIKNKAIKVVKAIYIGGGLWIYGDVMNINNVIAWMPIPSFDDILETNKDVLQRLKDK